MAFNENDWEFVFKSDGKEKSFFLNKTTGEKISRKTFAILSYNNDYNIMELMAMGYYEYLNKIEQMPQTQISLNDQLRILRVFANKLGLYDAADYLKP